MAPGVRRQRPPLDPKARQRRSVGGPSQLDVYEHVTAPAHGEPSGATARQTPSTHALPASHQGCRSRHGPDTTPRGLHVLSVSVMTQPLPGPQVGLEVETTRLLSSYGHGRPTSGTTQKPAEQTLPARQGELSSQEVPGAPRGAHW